MLDGLDLIVGIWRAMSQSHALLLPGKLRFHAACNRRTGVTMRQALEPSDLSGMADTMFHLSV